MKTSNEINPKKFLTHAVEISTTIKEHAAALQLSSQIALSQYEEAIGDLQENQKTEQSFLLPDWDPGLRSSKLSDNQKRYLIKQGPHQPTLAKFPQKDSIPVSKQRQFTASWYKEFPHLEYSICKDSAYCFICSLFGKSEKDPAWAETGVSTWNKMKSRGVNKKGKLALHFCSESHKAAVNAYVSFCNPACHVDALLDKDVRKAKIEEERQKLENKEVVKILLDIVKTLSRQDIVFRGNESDKNGNYRQIVALVARHCPLLEQWINCRQSRPYHVTYMAPESQNEMIKLLSDDVRQRIVDEIKEATMFGVSADTTPDLSKRDQMAVVCRYVNTDGDPKERLLSIKSTVSKKGDDTADEIITTLNSHTLDTDELCFQSYDFTNSMSGRYNGAQKKLQEKLQKNVPYVPCQGHRSNTVVEHSCNSSVIIQEMFNTLESLYVFFTSSTKRYCKYKSTYIQKFQCPLQFHVWRKYLIFTLSDSMHLFE